MENVTQVAHFFEINYFFFNHFGGVQCRSVETTHRRNKNAFMHRCLMFFFTLGCVATLLASGFPTINETFTFFILLRVAPSSMNIVIGGVAIKKM